MVEPKPPAFTAADAIAAARAAIEHALEQGLSGRRPPMPSSGRSATGSRTTWPWNFSRSSTPPARPPGAARSREGALEMAREAIEIGSAV